MTNHMHVSRNLSGGGWLDNPSAIMTNHHIGRVVIGCLTAGLVVALGLVLGPLGGAQEHVITGTVLLAFASSWALLATLSMLWTDQPQRWAAMPAGFMGLAGAGLLAFAPERHGHRRAWLGVAAASACAARGDRRSRPPGSAQSHPVLGRVPAVERLRALRCWRRLSNHPRVDRPPHVCGTRPVGRRRRAPASPELCRIGYSHRHPRIRPWRDCRVLGMDLDRGRTRHASVRLRPRGSRLERSGFCPAGRCRRGHGPPHPARSRARSGSPCARRPFVWRAVRPDLRRPVSRTGRRNGPARRPTCRGVRATPNVPGLLRWLPARLCAAPVGCSARSRAAGLSLRQRRKLAMRTPAACATSSPSYRPRLRRHVRFRTSATGRLSS